MKRIPKLNNKGFAVSVILYAAVVLIVLILFLILSILSTITKNKIQLVDNIKEEVSGNIDKKSESLGELIITTSDGMGSGDWHNTNFDLIISEPNNTKSTVPLVYYYKTDTTEETVFENKKITISSDMKNVTYYVRACRDAGKTICTKTSLYLVNIQKEKPTFTITGESTIYASSRIFYVTPTSLSGIDYYEYFVSNFEEDPSEFDEFTIINGNLNIINVTEKGTYLHIRAISNSNVKSDWVKQNLYVE